MGDFLKTWYGMAIFIAFDAAAVIAALALGYRFIFKRFLDMLVSLLCAVVCSPLYLALWIWGRVALKGAKREDGVFDREFFVGKKGRPIALCVFRTASEKISVQGGRKEDEGVRKGARIAVVAKDEKAQDETADGGNAALEKYFSFLRKTGLYKLPRLADVFCGKLSFIGVEKLTLADAAFVAESDEGRYAVRPGLINPLAVVGDEETDYAEMFRCDLRYARRLNLFGDCRIFFVWLLKKVRGEGRTYYGKTLSRSYAETLLEEGGITEEDFAEVARGAEEEEAELRVRYFPVDERKDAKRDSPVEDEDAIKNADSSESDGADPDRANDEKK